MSGVIVENNIVTSRLIRISVYVALLTLTSKADHTDRKQQLERTRPMAVCATAPSKCFASAHGSAASPHQGWPSCLAGLSSRRGSSRCPSYYHAVAACRRRAMACLASYFELEPALVPRVCQACHSQ